MAGDAAARDSVVEAQLERFIRSARPEAEAVRIEDLRVITGGYSQETYRCECTIEGSNGTERLPLIVRRDPPPNADILPTNRRLEFELIARVRESTTIPVPTPHFLDETGAALDRPTMLIERVTGSSDLTALFAPGSEAEAEAVSTELCERLAELHTTAIEVVDPSGELGDPRGADINASSWDAYMASSIAYFKADYHNIAFDPLPVFYDMHASLPNRLPAPAPLTLCHGDYQPSNFLCADGQVTGVIDWENAHIGDPREDLGWIYQMSSLTGFDVFGAVKADGGFLEHYSKLSRIPVSMEDVLFFQIFTSASLASPILDAVRRGLNGESDSFLNTYMLQPLVAAVPAYAAILGYPAAQEAV